MSWGEAQEGLEAARWFRSGRAGAGRASDGCTRVTKPTAEVCKRRAFYCNAFGVCFTMAHLQSPRQGAALCVSTGSLSPFQPRPAVWGRLCQVLAEAQEELQECARYQAVPLALIAAFLPIPCHDKFPAFVTVANTTRLCNEEHCPRAPSQCPGTRYHRITEP